MIFGTDHLGRHLFDLRPERATDPPCEHPNPGTASTVPCPTAKRPHLDRALTSEESWESPESTALTPCSIRPPARAATQRIRSRQPARDCHSRRLTSAWKPGTAPADLRRLTDATASSRPAMARLLRASVAIWAAVAPGRRPAWPDGRVRCRGPMICPSSESLPVKPMMYRPSTQEIGIRTDRGRQVRHVRKGGR